MSRTAATLSPTVAHPVRLLLVVAAGLTFIGLALGGFARFVWPHFVLESAENALRANDLDAVRRYLDHYRRLTPGDARAQLMAIQVARRLDAYSEAEAGLTELEHSHGPTDASRLEWLLLGVQQGDFGTDEARLQAQVDRGGPEAPMIAEAMAKGHMNSLRWPRMVDCLDRLLARSPAHVPALILRGRGREGLKHPAGAVDDSERAVQLAPNSPDARLALADAYCRLGRNREAAFHFEILCQQQPDHPKGLLGLARCRFNSAELDQARAALDRLLTVDPNSVDGLAERGRLAYRRGQPEVAEPFLARAVKAAPWHRDAWRTLAACYEELDRADDGRIANERLNRLEVEDAEFGRLSLRFRSQSSDPALRCDIGRWLIRNGQTEFGVRWLNSALRADSRHGPAHRALAEYFEHVGQPRRAALHRSLGPPIERDEIGANP